MTRKAPIANAPEARRGPEATTTGKATAAKTSVAKTTTRKATAAKTSAAKTSAAKTTTGKATAAKTSAAKKGAAAPKPRPADASERYLLRLYVTGFGRASAHAVERVRAICEEHLQGRYELEVVDIYQLPALAKGDQIVATPTVIRVLPAPLRRYIGNLSNEKILFGLDLREKK